MTIKNLENIKRGVSFYGTLPEKSLCPLCSLRLSMFFMAKIA